MHIWYPCHMDKLKCALSKCIGSHFGSVLQDENGKGTLEMSDDDGQQYYVCLLQCSASKHRGPGKGGDNLHILGALTKEFIL